MDIRVGRFILRSDSWSLWIDEEYTSKGKDGKPTGKTAIRKVAGYSRDWADLLRSFVKVQHRDNDAKTVKELLTVFKKVAEDTEEIKKTALKEDFKIIRKIAKENDIK